MATRSAIGIETEDKKIKYIFCYFDGYLSNNGRILADHYTTRALVNKLLDLGDLESLGRIPEGTRDYTEFKQFGKCHVVDFPSAAGLAESEEEYVQLGRKESCVFFYLFRNNQWFYLTVSGLRASEFLPVKSQEEKSVEEIKPKQQKKKSKTHVASDEIAEVTTEIPVVSEDLPDASPEDHDHVDVAPEDEAPVVATTETDADGSDVSAEPSEETNTNE